jgi:hypothetical protein
VLASAQSRSARRVCDAPLSQRFEESKRENTQAAPKEGKSANWARLTAGTVGFSESRTP